MKKEKTTQFLMKPKVDFCFKELMEDEEVRNAFLAAVLGINLEEIVESRILPSHLRQKDKDDKLGILDVRVLLNNKEQIDIEIQVTSSEYWAERTLFYLGKMFVDQLKPGEDYQKLEKCIHVGILNFTLFDDEEYYSRFHFWSDQGRKMYSDKFEIHTLELPKLAKHEYPETELLKWLQFINAETKEEFEMAAEKSEYIKKAYEDLNRISADEEKRLEYEARERAIRDHQYFSTVYKETGLREGRKEGLKIGRQEGQERRCGMMAEQVKKKERRTPQPEQRTFERNAKGVREMMSIKYDTFDFDGDWYQAFGRPEKRGVWLIWGQSGNGKTSFVASYMSIAFDKLSMFNDEGLCSLTSETDIDPQQFAAEPTALFLKIPDEKDTRHALAAVFVLCIYKALIKVASAREDLSLPRNVYFILDEFGNMPKIDKFDKMITVGRSPCCVAAQLSSSV